MSDITDWAEVDTSEAMEDAWHHGEPFYDSQETVAVATAEVYGDHEDIWRLDEFARLRREREEAADKVRPRTLGAADLRSMLDWDEACSFEDPGGSCELYGCDDEVHDDACPWSRACSLELQAIGVVLHRADPTFWTRLRKLGATPGLIAEANAILNPKRASDPRARALVAHNGRRRPRIAHARAAGRREHRSSTRRTVARAGPDDDPGPGDPPRLRIAPAAGAHTPATLVEAVVA